MTAVAPQAQTTATAIYEGANWSTTVTGTTLAYFTVQPWPLASGRTWTPAEQAAGKAVCIIGNTVRKNLFSNTDAVGKRFRIGAISCDVIGVLTTRGQGGFGDQDDVVLMPIKAVQRRFIGSRDIRLMLVGVDQAYSTSAVQSSLTDLLRERRHITGGKDDDFNIFDTKQISDTLTSTTTMLTRIVAAVAAMSLGVGGIGTMDLVLVSVTERTGAVGMRLAIGAVAREVLMQFLVEAVVLSCLGGIVGLILAQLIIAALVPIMQVPWTFDLQINIIAFAISAVIGVVFGYFPARRAAALNPIGGVNALALPFQVRGRVDVHQLGGRGHYMTPAGRQLASAFVALQFQQSVELARPEDARRGRIFAIARHHHRVRAVKGVEQAIDMRRRHARHVGECDQNGLGRRRDRLLYAEMQRERHALGDVVIVDHAIAA